MFHQHHTESYSLHIDAPSYSLSNITAMFYGQISGLLCGAKSRLWVVWETHDAINREKMRKVANSLVPTCANMCQHVPTTCIAWPHVDLRQKVSKSEHRSSCSSLRKALSPHLPFHSSPKSPPKPHAETARSLVESWSHLQERVFLTQAFLNDQAATKTGLATQRTCSRRKTWQNAHKKMVKQGNWDKTG